MKAKITLDELPFLNSPTVLLLYPNDSELASTLLSTTFERRVLFMATLCICLNGGGSDYFQIKDPYLFSSSIPR